ncbi:uncharacterized protein BP01DRAFT_359940 [Aspergillus saccharolyticus JOP 1030-1]|uniref:Uncharacterized protein n=1 Tax=Aspergillus saccharolyticus JOP 1030-1 TaxID=1450539 RepID=A0A318Z690_9EURO|nr:hypothetical protein BP01DRAFT_359940 [Aspergillus saccharolyticus JOP 1030-1]PYH41964.1 hypothetical protein BP01DRAFT_359940 [Aspergillus saccharolyticus JOP 1030-1]
MTEVKESAMPPLSPLRDDPACLDQEAAAATQQPAAHEKHSVNSHQEPQTTVVLPYAIEEPDDEPADAWETTTARPKSALLLGGSVDNESGDLADSMEGLYCDSDPTSRRSSFAAKRGTKRKPSNAPTASNRLVRPSGINTSSATSEGGIGGRPKRQRRRSQRSRNHLGLFTEVFWHGEASETGPADSHESQSPSADLSSSHLQQTTALDRMDLD